MPVKYCGCKKDSRGSTNGAKFQDTLYGEGMRLFTPKPDGSPAHCTVCGSAFKQAEGKAKRKVNK